MKLGKDLLRFMKEELGFVPSRKCLDFLLHACVNAKDMENGLFVWKEYQSAALPCNVLSFLRQATLFSPSRFVIGFCSHKLKMCGDKRKFV